MWNMIITQIWKDVGNWIDSKNLRSSNTKIGDWMDIGKKKEKELRISLPEQHEWYGDWHHALK